MLEEGASSALEAVTHCVVLLEDDPLYNAGRGFLLNVGGEVLLDTTIMDDRRTAWARNGDIRVETR
ncbi:MAG: isoaspartyl peptidase/L-asparaginase [Methylocella sp.]